MDNLIRGSRCRSTHVDTQVLLKRAADSIGGEKGKQLLTNARAMVRMLKEAKKVSDAVELSQVFTYFNYK